jgi:hypothetical protein
VLKNPEGMDSTYDQITCCCLSVLELVVFLVTGKVNVILDRVMTLVLYTVNVLIDLSAPTCDNESIGFVFVQELSQAGAVTYDISDSYLYSSSTSSPESSGSEYDPRTVHKSQKKKVNRKGKCDGTGKCKAKTSEFHGHNVVSVPFACQFFTKNNWSLNYLFFCAFF